MKKTLRIPVARAAAFGALVLALALAAGEAKAASPRLEGTASPRLDGTASPPTAGTASPRWIAHPDKPFDVLATEATVDEFKDCIAAGKCAKTDADEVCNIGKPGFGAFPINCINHDGAEALCAHLGGRLCNSKEWLAACRGIDNRAFPYGPDYQPSRCHVGTYEQPGPGGRTTIAAGSVPDCVGGLAGLFDMSGNVSEWISDCKGDYCKFRGAAYMGNDPVEHFAGCGEVCSGNDKGLKSGTVGVRCCRDRRSP